MSHVVIKASRGAIIPNIVILTSIGDSVELELEDGTPETLYRYLVGVGNEWLGSSVSKAEKNPSGLAALAHVCQQEMVHLVNKGLLRRDFKNPDFWLFEGEKSDGDDDEDGGTR